MTTADFQMPLDAVAVDAEVSCKLAQGPSFGIEKRKHPVVIISEFGDWTTTHVHGCSDRFDVLRIDAGLNSAKVIGLQPVRPRPYSLLPDRSMRHDDFSIDLDVTVSLAHCGSSPDPTRSSESSIFDTKVVFVNQPRPLDSHRDTSYTLTLRAEVEGYEE